MKINAFTLAEVLVTITIIGAVAAISIPSVIVSYQQKEYKTGLKKAMENLNQAITLNLAVEDETPYENSDLFLYLQRHMNVIRSEQGIFGGNIEQNAVFYTADGIRYETIAQGKNSSVKLKLHENNELAAGTHSLRSDAVTGRCGSLGLRYNPRDTETTPCFVTVDVNGDRKPSFFASNKVDGAYKYNSDPNGKWTDLFNVLITDSKVIPYGTAAQRAAYGK